MARSARVRPGQLIAIDGVLAPPELAAESDPDVPVEVVFSDDHVIVVDKAPGQVVHPGAGNRTGTMVHGLLARFPEIAAVGEPDRPGVVHRLDKGTSGVLVVARTAAALESLTGQLAERTVDRRYGALVHGRPDADRGIIDAPLGRSDRDPTRITVRDDGRPARTSYVVEASWSDPAVSLVTCVLETGRTPQIRVHMAAIGHPVVGDGKYGGARQDLGLDRPALHAAELAFDHPATGKRVAFSSPWPDDLRLVVGRFGEPADGVLPSWMG